MSSWVSLAAALGWRALRSPRTAAALVRVGWRFRARGWYARFPFLPVPEKRYLRWRMYTAYGDADVVPSADDVVRYARWAVRGP